MQRCSSAPAEATRERASEQRPVGEAPVPRRELLARPRQNIRTPPPVDSHTANRQRCPSPMDTASNPSSAAAAATALPKDQTPGHPSFRR